ncbi:J domain-containing protein [Haloarchaeobius amylolyticus]|uniref:J domain-containing protein n=1 Tax=Haloarchaeobius amylolyticus TaxID=1198296 RepID=A0ABD6BHM7_9EURY
MAVVGDKRVGCDGCGRTVALEELTTVTMPDGQQVACCPDCEPHARAAAQKGGSLDQRRDTCDGCTGTFLVAELKDVVLDDGTVVTCCPSCATEAPTSGSDDSSAPDTDDTTAVADTSPTTESEHTDEKRYRCTQCHEQVTEEPFRVTTIDERTERLCADCKAAAEDRGIVAAVDMRKTRAREILGVEPDVSDDELRDVYHDQIKRAHPDRKSGSKSAFQLVTEAYERLRTDE